MAATVGWLVSNKVGSIYETKYEPVTSITGSSTDLQVPTAKAVWSALTAVVPTTATANYVYAGPATGSPAAPAFRALVNDDIPTGITRTKLAAGTADHVLINDASGVISSEAQLAISRGGTGAASATQNYVFAGPASGGAGAPLFRALVAADLGTTLEPTFAVVNTPIVKATTSAGLQLRASNDAICVTFGAGGGCQAAFGDGATFAGLVNVTNAGGVQTQAAATQDAIRIIGRAGGTGTHVLTLTPATLDNSYTATFPAANIVVAGSASALTEGVLPVVTVGGLLADSDLSYAAGVVSRAGEIRLSATGTNVLTGYTNGSERMRINSSGQLLIGTTAAVGSEKLRVNGATVLGDISIGAADGIITRAGEIRLSATSTNVLTGYTNGSERWRVLSTGEFGIGTTTPDTHLSVSGAGVSLAGVTTHLTIQASGTGAANKGGALTFSTGTTRYASIIGASVSGSQDSYMAFYTRPASGNQLERMRINSSGQVLIGTTAAIGSETLRNNGATVLGDMSISATGTISRAGTITIQTTTATDVQIGTNSLSGIVVMNSGWLRYDFNASAFPDSGSDTYAVIGKTGATGSAPFDQAGSLVYRTRVSSTAGRSSHIFYTGSPSLERMRINETGQVLIGTTAAVGSELVRFAGGTEATATANDLVFGAGVLSIGGRLRQAGCFAEIHVHDASTAQAISTGATYTKLTAFTDNGPSANCTADATNDKITLTKTGYYRVSFSASFTCASNNVTWKCAAFLNGVEQDNCHWERKIGTGADLGNASFCGIIDNTTASWDLDVRMAHDQGGSENFTIKYANLNVKYIGET